VEQNKHMQSGYQRFLNRVVVFGAIFVAGKAAAKVLDFHGQQYKPAREPFLLLANHTDVLDPFYAMLTVNRPVRFVASDHLFRTGIPGKLFQYFMSPIVKHKEKTSAELIEAIKENLANGTNVGLFAEGGLSYNGETRYISPATAKMIKEANCDLLLYRSNNGYLRSPRWSETRRKGPMYAGIVSAYAKEELQTMSEEQIYDAICRDLYVNVYEDQNRYPRVFKGKKLAEHCEIILYQCPECKQVGHLHSRGNFLTCDCGYQVEMSPDGMFHDCGQGLVYNNICEWDHWQRTAVGELADQYNGNTRDPIFLDEDQTIDLIVDNKPTRLSNSAVVALYHDRFELHWGSRTKVIPVQDVKKLEYMSGQSLLLLTEDAYYDIGSNHPRSPIKYIDVWRHLVGKPNY